jgi:hypothetical protein
MRTLAKQRAREAQRPYRSITQLARNLAMARHYLSAHEYHIL